MKKSISIILAILILTTITTVFAVEGQWFSIEESKSLATENSKQTAIDDLTIKSKESALEDAQEDAKMSTGGNGKSDMLNNKIAKEVTPLKAAADLEYAKRLREENVDKLELEVYKATSKVLLVERELELEKSKQDILVKKYEMAQVRFSEGKLTENDLNDAKYALDLKTIDVNKATKKLETADLDLKRVLGLDMNGELVGIKDDLVLTSTDDIDIEKVVEEALKNDVELYIKAENLKASEKTMEFAKEIYEEDTVEYDAKMLELENAKVDFDDAKVNLEVSIRNKYNDILTAKDKVELAQKWEKINKSKLDNAEFKFEKGIISKEEVLNEKEKYLDSQYQTFLAIYDYNTVKTEFDTLYIK